MTRTCSLDGKLIEQFLRTMRFRHPATHKNYAGTLHNFNGFVTRSGAGVLPTVLILQQWLKERSLKWPAHILYHRTFLVERYLGWLQTQEVIVSNPFAELHGKYGPRTTPIVRALVHEDRETALRQLHRLPPFGSFLGEVMESHVAHRRVLGYRYDTAEELLLRLDRFLQRHPELSEISLNEIAERWVEEQPSPSRLFDARRAARVVSKAMNRLDPRVLILSIGDGIARAARQHHRAAHLYTDDEVQRILRAALAYPSPKSAWRPTWLFTMLMLAYCAGLRGGEIARLKLGDVDPLQDTIDIRETKFFKHRRHSMVSHRMREWYRSGINPQSKLPYLATYLGHKDIRSTLVYLNITPELLQEASERFRKNGAAALRATEGAR
jgi:integrase